MGQISTQDLPPRAPAKVTYLLQQQPVGRSEGDHGAALRGMLGACILGALEHYGRADHRRNNTTTIADVQLGHLDRVLWRNDHGVHGHGFEWAVHSVLNNVPGIPPYICRRVQQDLAAHTGAVLDVLGVHWNHVGGGLRSVMFGIERASRSRFGNGGELDAGALLWPTRGEHPFLLPDLLPKLHGPTGFSKTTALNGGNRPPVNRFEHLRQPDVPRSVSHLWRADLLIGGVAVEPTPDLLAITGCAEPTAWLAATLKYTAGKLEGGAGLHVGIDTNTRNGQRSNRPVTHWRPDGLRHVQLRVEDDFLRVFNSAWRLLRTAAAEHFPRQAHLIKFESDHLGLVAELGRRRGERAGAVADDFLSAASVASPVTTSELPPGGNELMPDGRRRFAPYVTAVPNSMGFAS